jgi:hypothetical protein
MRFRKWQTGLQIGAPASDGASKAVNKRAADGEQCSQFGATGAGQGADTQAGAPGHPGVPALCR